MTWHCCRRERRRRLLVRTEPEFAEGLERTANITDLEVVLRPCQAATGEWSSWLTSEVRSSQRGHSWDEAHAALTAPDTAGLEAAPLTMRSRTSCMRFRCGPTMKPGSNSRTRGSRAGFANRIRTGRPPILRLAGICEMSSRGCRRHGTSWGTPLSESWLAFSTRDTIRAFHGSAALAFGPCPQFHR